MYDVTKIAEQEIDLLSGSWQNCLNCADEFGSELNLDLNEIKDYAKKVSGGWLTEEIDGWRDREVMAFAIQDVATKLRAIERGDDDDGDVWYHEIDDKYFCHFSV